MNKLNSALIRFEIWRSEFCKNQQGQDLIEYALMAGFVAVSAGALMPAITTSISTVFSKIGTLMASAAS